MRHGLDVRSWIPHFVGCLLLAGTITAAVAARPEARDEPVLIIGDSIATGMLWHPAAVAVMQNHLGVDWQVAICRTLTSPSCPFEGERPPALVDLVTTLGRIPPIVVVEMGYNDPEPTFAASVDAAMSSLLAAGAQHVLWLTLRAARDPYPILDVQLKQAVSRWPQLELVDWDRAASGQYGWFQSDGVHLIEPGGVAMAHLVHGAVVAKFDPLHIDRPPSLHSGHNYDLDLHAVGGTPPYVWSVASGRPPRGFHLLADGHFDARLPTSAHAEFEITVRDADGATAAARLYVR
jgi:hypothetical protein